MKLEESAHPDFGKSSLVRRKPIKVLPDSLVKANYFNEEEKFPLILQPGIEEISLASWALNNREMLEARLIEHGAVLFRGFNINSASRFEEFARSITPQLLDYRERAAPRTAVGNNIYTSTEYPADRFIHLHHEMSYSHNWPMKIWFYCDLPAQQGGRTPIADDRKVITLIDPAIKERFVKKKVMYIRNYGEGVDLSWQNAFQCTERAAVEEYCRAFGIEYEWRSADRLRTRQIRQAIAVHPVTGETVWFNHAHLFHWSSLEPQVAESLLEQFDEDELPRNAFYGDGLPIDPSVLEEIREIYRRSSVVFDWQKGDILMVDNFLTSHGREPYIGERKILVAMAELYTNTEVLG